MNQTIKPLSILLTNDDGIHGQGLWELYRALADQGHRLSVVAPDRECSAVGHGLTLHLPIKTHKVPLKDGCEGWAVAGTPADCVKLAVAELLDERPDLVMTGVNPGANTGVNLNYSGTVAAAREAALCGLRAMAVSVQHAQSPRFAMAARFAARLAFSVQSRPWKAGTFLNVNVPDLPAARMAGVRLGYQGNGCSQDIFDKRRDPRHRTYYWYGCESAAGEPQVDSDEAQLKAGYITITPVRCDMTDYDSLAQMRNWGIESAVS